MSESPSQNSRLQKTIQHQYFSFLLRCQKTTSGDIRVRLINVQTGQEVPAVLLDEIPDLVRKLFSRSSD